MVKKTFTIFAIFAIIVLASMVFSFSPPTNGLTSQCHHTSGWKINTAAKWCNSNPNAIAHPEKCYYVDHHSDGLSQQQCYNWCDTHKVNGYDGSAICQYWITRQSSEDANRLQCAIIFPGETQTWYPYSQVKSISATTMNCVPVPKVCHPSNACAKNTCMGQKCSNGCGGKVKGTKNCTIVNPTNPTNQTNSTNPTNPTNQTNSTNPTNPNNQTNQTSPEIFIYSPTNGTIYNAKIISLKVGSDQLISSWYYSLNGANRTVFSPNTTITAPIGKNILIIYANNSNGLSSSTINFILKYGHKNENRLISAAYHFAREKRFFMKNNSVNTTITLNGAEVAEVSQFNFFENIWVILSLLLLIIIVSLAIIFYGK